MAESLLRSIAIHDALHPASSGRSVGLPGGGMGRGGGIAAMAAMGNPNGGFLDRMTGSPLGQIGMALLAGGGGGLGGAAQMLMQQGMYNRLARAQQAAMSAPHVEKVGETLGMLDPSTGAFTPTYKGNSDDEIAKMIRGAGKDPSSAEGQHIYQTILQNREDPTVNIPLPGGQSYMGPKSGLLDALQRLSGGSATPGALAPPSAPAGLPAASLATSVGRVESNNRDFNPDGSPVTSSAGAKFAMQVLPSTAHRPGYGVTPASDDSAAEYDRVGRDYLGALQRHYGGNAQEAAAAYNAGPGTVDSALANHLPLPSRGYVNKVFSGGNSGGGDVAAQAQAAIAAGADPNQVRARALQMGVTLP